MKNQTKENLKKEDSLSEESSDSVNENILPPNTEDE